MVWPGEASLLRLWDTIEKSGTGLLRPWQLRRIGLAETTIAAERLIAIAKVEKQIAAMRGTAEPLALSHRTDDNGKEITLIEPCWEALPLEMTTDRSRAIDQMRKEVNIEKAVGHAENTLAQNDATPLSDKGVDSDWFFKWRECASGVSTDSMQLLWGKVLAGEVVSPGSYGLRTLDFLKNLSADEAYLIERLASAVSDKGHYYYAITKRGAFPDVDQFTFIAPEELYTLEELGIINGVSTFGSQMETIENPTGCHHALVFTNRGIHATLDTHQGPSMSFFSLTKLGTNVVQLANSKQSELFLQNLAQSLANEGFSTFICDAKSVDGGRVSFTNKVKVLAQPK